MMTCQPLRAGASQAAVLERAEDPAAGVVHHHDLQVGALLQGSGQQPTGIVQEGQVADQAAHLTRSER